ncbi:MAG: PaaI family thioesterase [Firmicutes bacterium]|nr:PaaI family thioesterase [Bacillota bacterium]
MPIENRGIDEELFEAIIAKTQSGRALEFFGIDLKYLAEGAVVAGMTIKEEHSNTQGISHGGLAAALVDTVMGLAVFTLNRRVVTLEMNLNYVAPARVGATLTAEARVVHRGSNTAVSEAEVHDDRGELVVKSRGTFFIIGHSLVK